MVNGRHYGAAIELSVEKFGGHLVESEDVITIATSVTILVPRNPERVFIFVLNVGVNPVYIKTLTNPSVGSGLLLSASGGYFSFNAENDAVMPTRGWKGIADGGSSDLYVVQLSRETIVQSSGEG